MRAFLPKISFGSSQHPRQEKLSDTELLTHSHQPVQGRDSNAKVRPPNPILTSNPEREINLQGEVEKRGGEEKATWGPIRYSATQVEVDSVIFKLLGMEHMAAQNSRYCLMVVPNSKFSAERTVPAGSCTETLCHFCPTICEEVGEGVPFFQRKAEG